MPTTRVEATATTPNLTILSPDLPLPLYTRVHRSVDHPGTMLHCQKTCPLYYGGEGGPHPRHHLSSSSPVS
jgi:hypothetical protein